MHKFHVSLWVFVASCDSRILWQFLHHPMWHYIFVTLNLTNWFESWMEHVADLLWLVTSLLLRFICHYLLFYWMMILIWFTGSRLTNCQSWFIWKILVVLLLMIWLAVQSHTSFVWGIIEVLFFMNDCLRTVLS